MGTQPRTELVTMKRQPPLWFDVSNFIFYMIIGACIAVVLLVR